MIVLVKVQDLTVVCLPECNEGSPADAGPSETSPDLIGASSEIPRFTKSDSVLLGMTFSWQLLNLY